MTEKIEKSIRLCRSIQWSDGMGNGEFYASLTRGQYHAILDLVETVERNQESIDVINTAAQLLKSQVPTTLPCAALAEIDLLSRLLCEIVVNIPPDVDQIVAITPKGVKSQVGTITIASARSALRKYEKFQGMI